MKFDKSSQNLSGKKRKDTQDNTKELQSTTCSVWEKKRKARRNRKEKQS